MSREFNGGSLADGQLQDAQTAMYTAPSGAGDLAVYVRSVSLYNTSATPQVVLLWIKRAGGTARRFCPRFELDLDEAANLLSEGEVIVLSPGDALLAQTTTDNVVDFIVTGVAETEV